jgi:hypothetical protein
MSAPAVLARDMASTTATGWRIAASTISSRIGNAFVLGGRPLAHLGLVRRQKQAPGVVSR